LQGTEKKTKNHLPVTGMVYL